MPTVKLNLLSQEQELELDGELEQHQVHEIIQQEDGTIMEVYYYQPRDQLYDPDNRYHDTIIIQPENMKTEPTADSL